jgi:hypothetical protein
LEVSVSASVPDGFTLERKIFFIHWTGGRVGHRTNPEERRRRRRRRRRGQKHCLYGN